MSIVDKIISLQVKEKYNLSDDQICSLKQSVEKNNFEQLLQVPLFTFGNYHQAFEPFYFTQFYTELYFYYPLNIFFDSNRRIVIHSNQIYRNNVCNLLNDFIIFLETDIDSILKQTNIQKYDNVVTIEKFNFLYGHLKDEMFCLAEFCRLANCKGISVLPLINFPNTNSFTNIKTINDIIFDNTTINPEYNKQQIIQVKQLKNY